MAIVISGTTGIDMGGNPVSNASKIDSAVINENGNNVATNNDISTINTNKVSTNSVQALHSTDALSISGTTISLNKADGTSETIGIPAQEPTSTQVGTAIAGIAASAIGSYMFGTIGSTGTLAFGATIAGSSIRPTSTNITSIGTARSGTWRCMGHITDNGATVGTLFLRIA